VGKRKGGGGKVRTVISVEVERFESRKNEREEPLGHREDNLLFKQWPS